MCTYDGLLSINPAAQNKATGSLRLKYEAVLRVEQGGAVTLIYVLLFNFTLSTNHYFCVFGLIDF